MSLMKLPELNVPYDMRFELPKSALDRWSPEIRADNTNETAINIYTPIGKTFEGDGFTASKMAGILRNFVGKPITVNINSPGGSLFDGVAIYNQLRAHEAEVTVNIVGIAASAASIIAMAGDRRMMGEASYLMIHNSNVLAIGDRNTLSKAAETLKQIDQSMADLYSMHTGISADDIANMMDTETWLNAKDAIQKRFATGKMEAPIIHAKTEGDVKALTMIEQALQILGYTRSERREALKEYSKEQGKPSATEQTMPRAGIQTLLETLQV